VPGRLSERENRDVRILIAEDEQVLADRLAAGLRQQAFAVDVSYAGDTALERLAVNPYDVVILDRDLPKVHGDDVCREVVRSAPGTRILMLTASGSVQDRVNGLNLGADDYLPKPFDYPELVARIHALARRVAPALPPTLRRAGITLDPARHQVSRDGVFIPLSRKEFSVLQILMSADGAVVSQEELLTRAWDETIDPFTNSARVVVSRLRAKLGEPPVIMTLPGLGYVI
jgi:DNA-binding response OmpR family regulator